MPSDRSNSHEMAITVARTGRRLRPYQAGIISLALALAGCHGSTSYDWTPYQVKGRVLLASGRPLTAGRVTFVSSDGVLPSASGDIGADGKFALSTRAPGDGAVPGRYKVRIEPAQGRNRRPTRPIYPLKYIDEDSSDLFITVQAEPNQLQPITLK
jgi:hypothetical protein